MLKTVMYYLLLLTTVVRFGDLIFLLTRDSTNLPVPVLLTASALVLYGMVLATKKFLNGIRFKQLTHFFAAQALVIVFNLAYVAKACPLKINAYEAIAVGTVLDLIVCGTLVYMATKHLRSSYVTVQL